MLEIQKNGDNIVITDSNKSEILLDTVKNTVVLDWFDVTFPGEYEKSWILLEVKEFDKKLFYSFAIEQKHLVFILNDKFDLKEEILSFFWDVDILVITWTKDAVKIFENVEAKLVVPYWETKDLFFHELGQHIEEVQSYKIKSELSWDITEFVNIA